MKKEDIEHLGTLARIRLSGGEGEKLAADITDILDYVGAINEITAIEKEKKAGGRINVMREDIPTHKPGEHTEALLDAAPKRKGQYVEVKKILDKTG